MHTQWYKFTHEVPTAKTFTTTDVDLTADTITIANHGYSTGEVVGLTTTSSLPTGLAVNTAYYVINTSRDTFQLAANLVDAVAGTDIDITAVGAGTQSVHKNGFGQHDLGYLPDNSIILRAFYDVETIFLPDGTGTLSIGTGESTTDVVDTVATNDGAGPWDAGFHGTLIGNFAVSDTTADDTVIEVAELKADNNVKVADTTQHVIPSVTTATATMTSGKMNIYFEVLLKSD